MQGFRVTSSDNGHYHVIYINTESQVGAVAFASDKVGRGKSHTHTLEWDPPRPPRPPTPEVPPPIDPLTGGPVIDPQTGLPVPGQPADPGDPGKEEGSWVVLPSEEDGHTHEVTESEPLKATSKKDKGFTAEDKAKLHSEAMALAHEAYEATRESRESGCKAERFYKGEQWKQSDRNYLEGLNRACLTINEVAPNIDTLLGYQMEQRTDIRYLPQESGDQRAADVFNVISKRLLSNCYFAREESKVFKDEVLPGFGCFNIYVDFDKTIEGDVKIERYPWYDIMYGPFEKEDLSDCEYEVRSRMVSIAKLKQLYPDQAGEIESSFESYTQSCSGSEGGDANHSGTNLDYRYARKTELGDGFPLVDVQRKNFRLMQVTQKTYKKVTILFNPDEDFYHAAMDWDKRDFKAVSTIPGFNQFEQVKTRFKITRLCGDVLLTHEDPADLVGNDFTTTPVYAYKNKSEFWGKVKIAEDPQMELNKRRSQIMDTLARLGGAIYYAERETFVDPNELENFKRNRSKPGSFFMVNDLNRTPKLEEGAEIPSTLINIMQLDQQNLQRLMNILVAQDSANESGTIFLEKKKGKITGNQFLFDNLSFAKQRLGRQLLHYIVKYYPPDRCLRILNSQYSRERFDIAGQDFSTYSREEIVEILSNTKAEHYDVIVTESSFSESTRLGIAKVLFQLLQQGSQIPPDVIFDLMDVPEDIKIKISDRTEQQLQQEAKAQSDTSNSEITKTLIAKGQYTVTPEKAAELGLVPTQQTGLQETPPPGNNQDSIQTILQRLNDPAVGI